jgi:hypothetical protein
MMITGEANMRAFRISMVQRAMALELKTGMKMSRHNTFDVARQYLGITTRSKQKVYDLFVAAMPRLIEECSQYATESEPLTTEAVLDMAENV